MLSANFGNCTRRLLKGNVVKPTLGLVGFFGRGNCGDEAILQCIYEAFREEFDIVIVVDEVGAIPGWWDLYPYSECERVHYGNFHYFMRPMAGIIVGGGGLGIGYGASHAICARSVGTPTALAGVDYTHFEAQRSEIFAKVSADYYALFDYAAVRSQRSVEFALQDGIAGVRHGADWALLLPTDESPEIDIDDSRVLLTLRHWEESFLASDYPDQIRALLKAVRDAGYSPVFLPFCEADQTFLTEMDLADEAPLKRTWWNPRRVKQIIASSRMMLSVGRLHPVVIAAAAGTPALQIRTPLSVFMGTSKLEDQAEELQLPQASIADAIAVISAGGPDFTEDASRSVQAARSRLEATVAELRDLFLNH